MARFEQVSINKLLVNEIQLGTAWGSSTTLETAAFEALDDITAGTGAASKALILDANGTVLMPAPFRYEINTGITAYATGGQANAVALTGEYNNVTTCATDGDSVKLPAALGGESITVKNSGAASLAVFPATGDSINAMAVNLSVNIAPGGTLKFFAISATVWETQEVLVLPAPSTQKGELIVKATDNDGDTVTTLTNAAMGQATVISLPDPGAATANVLLTDAANDGVVVTSTAAEINNLDRSVNAALMAPGTGADGMDAYSYSVQVIGNMAITRIYLDIDGLFCGGTADDIIGEDGIANANLGQITAAINGTIIGGTIQCLEALAGGDTTVSLWSATEETGAEDSAITDLTETELHSAFDGSAMGAISGIDTAYPAADEYLYLTGDTGGNAEYTAGKLLITLYGILA
jgi:hypothetical protein